MTYTPRQLVLLSRLILLIGTSRLTGDENDAATSPAQSTSKPKAKKVYTNEDLKSSKGTTRVNQPRSTNAPQKAGSRGTGIEGYRDTGGHDREYWQKRIRPLNNQLE